MWYIQNIHNMQNMQNMTCFSWPCELGTLVLLHPSVGLCTEFEQEQTIANPDVTYSELKSAAGDSGRVEAPAAVRGFPQH
jgi:hypothetical protein